MIFQDIKVLHIKDKQFSEKIFSHDSQEPFTKEDTRVH